MPKKQGRHEGDDIARQPNSDEQLKPQAADWLITPADPFDIWLREQLRETFGHVCSEPIPDDILRLVEEDRAERECIRRSRSSKQRK
jgi:hypothetical protein